MHRLIAASMLFLLATSADARTMKLTIYDDGASCPSNCDAHVVFNKADNGTRYAFSPSSTRAVPKNCERDHECTICFSEDDKSCMTVMYRKAGPEKGRFDFTPKFYGAYCSRTDIPTELKSECATLDRNVKAGGWDKRINCFTEPANPKCVTLIAEAKAAQDADIPKRDKCLQMGQAAYNKAQADPKDQRDLDCNYTKLSLGGRPGHRWRNLLPGACRPGASYVAPNGLDCCSADVRFAAANGKECLMFFPSR